MVVIQEPLSALLAILLLLYLMKRWWSHQHYPPGPLSLPIIGSIWRIRFGIGLNERTMIKMSKQYGNVFTLWLGDMPIVLLSGFETVKEGLIDHSEELSGRASSPYVKFIGKGKGITFSNGDLWKQQRRFAVGTMRKLGTGRKSMESQIEVDAQKLVEIFAREKGQPFDPALPIINSVSNVTCIMLFGHRFPLEDENFKELIDAIECTFKFGGSPVHILFELFPWILKRLPGPHMKALESIKIMFSLGKKEILKHKKKLSSREPQDFIDHYLLHIEKEQKNDPTSIFDEDNLAHCISDLFIAGTHISALFMQWAILLLTNRPYIQDKIIKEIDDVLGSSSICYEDHKQLPYTNAVFHEIMRYRYVVLIGTGRQTTKDVNIGSFFIPKETVVIPDMYAILHDPQHWETPEEFNPNHFLDKDGNFVTRKEFLVFGAGARLCLGEHMGRMQYFLFLTSLLKAFHLQLPPGVKELSEEIVIGTLLSPKPHKICAVPRESSSKSIQNAIDSELTN
ncbi:cytochrome P450 2J5-like [Anolis sagrei]|uniref:cytochrome P450 2J5-like n=1 Tax=Anolis sagrei TaxID=38937 RepID=UPI00351FD328